MLPISSNFKRISISGITCSFLCLLCLLMITGCNELWKVNESLKLFELWDVTLLIKIKKGFSFLCVLILGCNNLFLVEFSMFAQDYRM